MSEQKPETWDEFLMRQNQNEFGVTQTKLEALASMLEKPESDDPADATNVIMNMLKDQNK